jgi:hypothetical protein
MRRFGFTSKLLDKSENNGKKSFYVSLELANEIFDSVFYRSSRLKEEFFANYMHYGQKETLYRCNFYFRRITFIDNTQKYVAIGNCGSYGFNGGQYTKRETLSPYVVKQCLEQLYDYLEKYDNV